MKNFKEKELKELHTISGGIEGEGSVEVKVEHTINWDGFFDGSLFRHGKINELDERKVTVKVEGAWSLTPGKSS